jgi:hypothetical protein
MKQDIYYIITQDKVIKKGPLFNGPLNSTSTKTFGADMKFSCFSASDINTHILDIYQPAASCMTVRVADSVACHRTTAAAITIFGQSGFPPYCI